MRTLIINDALPRMLANAVFAEFPDEDWRHWHKYDDHNSLKYATKDPARFPPVICKALGQLGTVIEKSVAGIHYPESFVDYEFHAAGLHMIPPAGHLRRHQDAARHPILPWRRTLSACWYATPDWSSDWGGEIVIDEQPYFPRFNSLVIFESNRWHSVNQITGPEARRVLSLFCWEIDTAARGETRAQFQSLS